MLRRQMAMTSRTFGARWHTGPTTRRVSDRTMCLVLFALIFSPRIVMILWWLLDTARWAATFDGPLLPILGFVLAPWTTLMYVLVAPGGLTGLDWLWMR